MEDELEQQINFLVEIDKLKDIERRTKILRGSRLENDAEHSWHLAMMAMILHKQANREIDLFHVMKILLVHDLVEIDAGDTFDYDTQGQTNKFEREVQAATRIFGLLPEEQGKELMDLWLEFENKETDEAKFAASLDRLQPLIFNHLNQGDTWKKYGITADQVTNRNREIAKGSTSLWEYADKLIKKSVDQGILSK